jgi:hypothetical protein
MPTSAFTKWRIVTDYMPVMLLAMVMTMILLASLFGFKQHGVGLSNAS